MIDLNVATVPPLLSSPPGFVLLGVMIGLAAYLRNLAETRTRQIDEIESERLWNYPLVELHTQEKLGQLRRSRNRLNNWVAPIAIWFTIAIGFRLAALAYVQYGFPDDPLKYAAKFRLADCAIVVFLFVGLFALLWMHHITKRDDDRIRAMMDGWKASRKRSQAAANS